MKPNPKSIAPSSESYKNYQTKRDLAVVWWRALKIIRSKESGLIAVVAEWKPDG